MNNRYLYKAKKIYKEEWVEGFYVLCRGHHYILPVYDLDHGFDERYSEWVEIEPSTLCQCTGLMDKNDKLIWENEKCLITKIVREEIRDRVMGTFGRMTISVDITDKEGQSVIIR